MAYYACQSCKHSLDKDTRVCPACGLENPHQKCRECREIVPQGIPRCPSCKTKAPLKSKKFMLFRSYGLPILIVFLFMLMSSLKR